MHISAGPMPRAGQQGDELRVRVAAQPRHTAAAVPLVFLGRLCKLGDLRIQFDSRGSCLFPNRLTSERSPHACALDAIVEENHGCVSGLASLRFCISVAVAHTPNVWIIRRVDVGKAHKMASRSTHSR